MKYEYRYNDDRQSSPWREINDPLDILKDHTYWIHLGLIACIKGEHPWWYYVRLSQFSNQKEKPVV